MGLKAINYKNWCTENISPQSWSRILLGSLEAIKDEGYTIKELENPDANFELSESLLNAFNHILDKLYQLKIEESVLVD